ncbi:BAK_1a_G0037680.mRNA.1.CDS.1 [Saccharomyces cerevisiae]|nr:HLJ1_G0029990.mRNA.1.CDS.1 [Saccharomyces cerevisiae]CAI4631504.1 BAK_1a_G0037680.mRNA.1.CDS.1 [Saccharomyces cerevisiae]CAI4645116.1 BAI_1a_G0037680.mRNA.1.CDS.1 [Saccharomyces cerevisiae]CAI4646262.1 CCN_G0037850.mRNA.1.CDS.1 [Saccharomyces cerevisiae]CAI7243524.1 BAI_1a_G0037680.mRNA.1.CDS.1 [Saccharomyces cerevisiae]
MNVFMPIRVFLYSYVIINSLLSSFSPISVSIYKKKGAAFGVSNFEKICVTLIVNELI